MSDYSVPVLVAVAGGIALASFVAAWTLKALAESAR